MTDERKFVDFVECKCGTRYTTQQSLFCPGCGATDEADRTTSIRVYIKEKTIRESVRFYLKLILRLLKGDY
jgi:hypothetical protein